jgi:hypothetical protein
MSQWTSLDELSEFVIFLYSQIQSSKEKNIALCLSDGEFIEKEYIIIKELTDTFVYFLYESFPAIEFGNNTAQIREAIESYISPTTANTI